MVQLRDIGEFGFIDRIAPSGIVRPEGVVKGIGDDCAAIALDSSQYLLITTDLLVEHVHFHLDWAAPETIGAKSLAVNLSDIAACGGTPRDVFMSIAVPPYIEVEWLDGFYRGLRDLARIYGVNVLGGDTTRSKGHLVINIAVTGLVLPEEVLFRHTALPGNVIAVTGSTGNSGAGLDLLLNNTPASTEPLRSLIESHLNPRPHVQEGRILAESKACTAAIDVSDGLTSDLLHICSDSGIGALLYEDSLPISEELISAAEKLGKNPLDWVFNGGEDYVLLTAIRRDRLSTLMDSFRKNGSVLFPIGEFVPDPGIVLLCRDGVRQELNAAGWDHFR